MADWIKLNEAGPGSGSGFANISEWTLIGGTTEITTAIVATSGALLIIVLIQDGTGGRLITWSASFAAGTSLELAVGIGETTIFTFVGRSDALWHQLTIQKLP